MDNFDWKNPDYIFVMRQRTQLLISIRSDPAKLAAMRVYYKSHPWDFISDWGMTYDPKNVERNLPALIPFVLFPRQTEWVREVRQHWIDQKPMLTEKTRQMGFSWLAVATACTMCIFNTGISIGFGSRKEEYVDRIGDPKSLFHKARLFMQNLPEEFRSGWDMQKSAPHMRIIFPHTGSIITGEAGDNIGRGATTSLYIVDESAFLERPHLIDASLSMTTNCRIDISTPNGMGNPFAEKRFSGRYDVFTFKYLDDPRKDAAWYEKMCATLDPVTVAQEIDIDYSASVEGVVIPAKWVMAAIDAHTALGIDPSGVITGALDVADQGTDKNAYCGRHGSLITYIEEWTGKDSTLYKTAEKAVQLAKQLGHRSFIYDADGLGAAIRGDVIEITKGIQHPVTACPFRGSGPVMHPDKEDVRSRKNSDYFANAKAQAWWNLRLRFERTYQWVRDGIACDPDMIISIDSRLAARNKLVSELSQPTYSINSAGKIVIDKKPGNNASPNLADAVMMAFSPQHAQGAVITMDSINSFKTMGRTRR